MLLADESQPRVTIVFYETPLREALNEISLQTGVNIIPDYTVEGVVTADLNNVPLEKALEIILSGGGYTFTIRITIIWLDWLTPGVGILVT